MNCLKTHGRLISFHFLRYKEFDILISHFEIAFFQRYFAFVILKSIFFSFPSYIPAGFKCHSNDDIDCLHLKDKFNLAMGGK